MDTPFLIAFIVLGVLSLASLLFSCLCLSRMKKTQDVDEEIDRLKRDLSDKLDSTQNALTHSIGEGTRTSNDITQKAVNNLTSVTSERLEAIRSTVEKKMESLQAENTKKLDEMRGVVDEKLQKTLDSRMAESFKLVTEKLESVYKELGEMQTLATGVGDLKKILSNVKTRGVLGEVQLGRILEQMLTPDQYDCNVRTKQNSRDPVEFAIRIPAKDGDRPFLYLPIDAKFPVDRYTALLDAYDTADAEQIEKAGKEFEAFIKLSAKTIRDKYIDPPYTTNFAILFLPTEGLYSEVVRRPALFENLQNDYSVTVTGPSTVTAFLNSLQMGFRTLAIEKRSGEVWQLLGAVKTEFGKFETVLKKMRDHVNSVDNDLNLLINTRTNTIMRRLKSVQELPAEESERLLAGAGLPETGDDEE